MRFATLAILRPHLGGGDSRAGPAAARIPLFPDRLHRAIHRRVNIQFSPPNFVGCGSGIIELIAQAYGVKPFTIFGGPAWVRADRFSILATTTGIYNPHT